MNIITRAQWGARYGDGRFVAPLPADEVWLHHSVTVAPDLVAPFNDDYAAIRTIERIGMERFGKVYGFPYTFGITPAGLVFAGHHIAKTGAHTAGHNTRGRGICLVGNYEDHKPPPRMRDALIWLLRHGHAQGWWRRPQLTGGHRDVKTTACPGRHAYALIREINHRAANPLEDDMPSPADLWNHPLPDPYIGPKGDKAQPKPAYLLLAWAATHAAYAKEQVIATRAEVAALRSAVGQLAARAGIDVATLVAAHADDIDHTTDTPPKEN